MSAAQQKSQTAGLLGPNPGDSGAKLRFLHFICITERVTGHRPARDENNKKVPELIRLTHLKAGHMAADLVQ